MRIKLKQSRWFWSSVKCDLSENSHDCSCERWVWNLQTQFKLKCQFGIENFLKLILPHLKIAHLVLTFTLFYFSPFLAHFNVESSCIGFSLFTFISPKLWCLFTLFFFFFPFHFCFLIVWFFFLETDSSLIQQTPTTVSPPCLALSLLGKNCFRVSWYLTLLCSEELLSFIEICLGMGTLRN